MASQDAHAGVLPAVTAWAFEAAEQTTPPIVTGGDGPSAQRVAYGTADGRVHLRALGSGAEVGPAGGTLVADAPITNRAGALRGAFVSSSTEAQPATLYVVHDDGGGVEIARFDEATGRRLDFDAAIPGGLGCNETGAPLLTPTASDGTRLLFFVISGNCSAGEGLVRIPVESDGTLGAAAVGPVADPAGDPTLTVFDDRFVVAVGRPGGVDLFDARGTLAAPTKTIELAPTESPVGMASGPEYLYVLTAAGSGARLQRFTLGLPAGSLTLAGTPSGLAAGAQHVVVTTDEALYAVGRDLTVTASAPGDDTAPAVAGDLAFQGGRAVQLSSGAVTALAPGDVTPALARGFVVYGPRALLTTDATPPDLAIGSGLAATAGDDRGIAGVLFQVGGRKLTGRTAGSPWAPALYKARTPLALAPGSYSVRVGALDLAGNGTADRSRLKVRCDRKRRGTRRGDRLRGGRGRDCIAAGGGNDRIVVRGGGADRVRCGPGRDVVRADRKDRVARDCERRRAG